MKRLAVLVALGLALFGGPAPAQPAYDPEPWLQDLAQARSALSAGYANLDWAVRERGMDLPAVTARAERRLRAASNDAEARRAFERFLEAFADGHLEVEWARPVVAAPPAAAALPPSAPAPLCQRLGFQEPGPDTAATASRLPGYRALDTNATHPLPAGVVDSGGRKLGVLRIALFDYRWSPEICAEAIRAMRLTPQSPCEEPCQREMERLAGRALTEALEARLRALKAAGADTLLVDITGNGGGSEWSWVAARAVTAAQLRTGRTALVRHPHHTTMLESRRKDLLDAAARASGEDRGRLLAHAETATQALAQLRQPCDRSGYWRGEVVTCDAAVRPFFISGWTDLPPPPFGDPALLAAVYWPAGERVTPGVWDGRLVVLIDRHTHSAAEGFAALLQDNRAALIVGAPSGGTGCGHIDGRITERLRNSGGLLVMPNCSRLRADGSNEVSGIEPDVLLSFRENDSQAQRARRLAAALPAILAASDGRGPGTQR